MLPLPKIETTFVFIIILILYGDSKQGLENYLSNGSLLFLFFLQPDNLRLKILNVGFGKLLLSLIRVSFWRRKLLKYSIFSFFDYYLSLSFLTVQSLLDLDAFLMVAIYFLCVVLYQLIFIPDGFGLKISYLAVNILFVFSFYSLLFVYFMLFDIVLNSFHNNLTVKLVFSLGTHPIWIVLEFDTLSDAVELKCFESLFYKSDLIISETLLEFLFLFLKEALKFIVFFYSG